jgi:hypothetical protein
VSCSNYIDLAYRFARELVAHGEVRFTYLATNTTLADVFTEPVARAKLEMTCAAIGVGMGQTFVSASAEPAMAKQPMDRLVKG